MNGYLGLGSNQGDRRANLEAAVGALIERGIELLASSSVYETEPVGLITQQRQFLNACLRIDSELDPEQLLDTCKQIERELGRGQDGIRHGPRPIDVDVLILDRVQYRSERLTLPHPEIAKRRFVLVPLLELDPDLTLLDGNRLADALEAIGEDGQRVAHAGDPLV